jgi:hypothetical protein
MSNQKKANRRRSVEQAKLLKAAQDAGAVRVQVKDEKGKLRYRDLDKLADSDVIQTKKDGSPVVMMTKPGRRETKSKAGPASAVVAHLMQQKQQSMASDPLLGVVKDTPESHGVLQHAMVVLAEETASIGFERKEAERQGDPTSQLSARRINAVKALVDTWLKRQDQIVSKAIDLDSPALESLMGFVMETFRGAMSDTNISEDTIRTVFARISKAWESDEWKSEAKARMKRSV